MTNIFLIFNAIWLCFQQIAPPSEFPFLNSKDSFHEELLFRSTVDPIGQNLVLKPTWGNFSGQELKVAQGKELLDSTLSVRILPPKKAAKTLKVSSFIFYYRQKEEFFNDETEKKETFYYTVEHKCTGNILPDLWRNIIRQRLKSGETIWFEQIIFTDEQGRSQLAPNWEIKIN